MRKTRSIKFNFLMESLLTMSSFVFPLITFPYVSRVLLPAGIGKISFATSLITYFNMLSNLGIPKYGIRACAKVRDNEIALTRTVHELMTINLVTTAISYILFFLALVFVPQLREEKQLYLIISISILLNTIGIEWMYKGLEQYAYITIRSVIFKFIALGAMFLLIHKQSDYLVYGAISIFAASASNIFNFFHAHHFIKMKPVGNYNCRQHIGAVLVFFAMACATTVYTHLDTVMLGFMKTDDDVGYYHAAVKIKTILVSIVTSLGTVLLPRASYYVEHGMKDAFQSITRKALNFVVIIALPLTVYFMVYAKQGVFLLSGSAFEGAVLPMQIIMPTLLLIGLSNITGIQILVPLGKEKIVLYSEIAGSITDLFLNMLLIPRYAASGAAVGTLIAELVVLGVQYFALRNEIHEDFVSIHWCKIIVASFLGVVLSYCVSLMTDGSFSTLLVTSVVFFGIYGIILVVTKEKLVIEIIEQMTNKLKKT